MKTRSNVKAGPNSASDQTNGQTKGIWVQSG